MRNWKIKDLVKILRTDFAYCPTSAAFYHLSFSLMFHNCTPRSLVIRPVHIYDVGVICLRSGY